MNRQDKLFQAFRKQQHQAEEMPSPQSWDRLRKRLDNRKRSSPTRSIYRLFSMAAAVVGLVIMVTIVMNLSPTKKIAQKTQELPTYSKDVLQKAIAAHTYRTQNQLALKQRIEEGTPTQLIVNKKATRPTLLPKKKDTI